MNFAQFYLQVIVVERQWSWSLIGIGYLVLTLIVRQFIFRVLVWETKEVDPQLYAAIKALYLKKSVGGWIVFLISWLLLVTAWINAKGLLNDRNILLLFSFLFPLLFCSSVILHLLAFTQSLLAVVRQRFGAEKEF